MTRIKGRRATVIITDELPLLQTEADVDAYFGKGADMGPFAKNWLRYVNSLPPVRKVKVGR